VVFAKSRAREDATLINSRLRGVYAAGPQEVAQRFPALWYIDHRRRATEPAADALYDGGDLSRARPAEPPD
jgi:hypothetical protein